MQAQRETLGDRHPETLASIHNMSGLLKDMGQLEEARLLYEEALQASRETLGDRHPDTLGWVYNLADLLENQGKIEEAVVLFTELEECVSVHGMQHNANTETSVKHLVTLLRNSGQLDEAKVLAARHGVSLNGWQQSVLDDGATYWWRSNKEEPNGVEITLTDPEA